MLYRGFMGCVLSFIAVTSASSATLYPFLGPIRTELVEQIAIARTNGSPSQLRLLTQARNAIDRRGRATLTGDLQALSTVSTVLARTRVADDFAPLLDQAVLDYFDVVTNMVFTLQTNVDLLPPGNIVDAAQLSLENVNNLLEDVPFASTPSSASRLLGRSAVQLLAVETLVSRLTEEQNRVQQMIAFVGSESFVGNNTGASYSPGTGFLTITGSDNTRGLSRSITLTLSDVRPGTSVHNLGSAGSSDYAVYSQRGTNTLGYTSNSGYVTVTIDPSGRTVSGNFSFTATASTGRDAPLQVSGGEFFSRLR